MKVENGFTGFLKNFDGKNRWASIEIVHHKAKLKHSVRTADSGLKVIGIIIIKLINSYYKTIFLQGYQFS